MQDDHHYGGDLHDAQRLVAGFFDALDVFPPVINGYQQGKGGGGVVFIDMRRAVKHGVHGARNPAMGVGGGKEFVDQSGDVLSRGNAGDRAGEDVVEHQRGDAELGERPAQRLFHHAVDAAAGEHGAAFHVNRAHSEGKQHHAQDEPWGRLADGLLGDAAGIKRGRAQIIQHDGGGPPIGDECEHDRGRDHDADPVRKWWDSS